MNILGLEIKRNNSTANKPDLFGRNLNSANGFFAMQQQVSKLGSTKEQMKAYVDWVYAAVKARSESVADVEFVAYANRTSSKSGYIARRVYENKNNYIKKMAAKQVAWQGSITKQSGYKPALEELENHKILDLLYHPNKWYTKELLIETVSSHMDLTGMAYVYKVQDGAGNVVELWPLDPSLISVVPDAKEFIRGFVYRNPQGEDIPFDTEEIMFFRDVNPRNPFVGMGVVQAAARAIDTDTNAADWNRNFFYNSATPQLALMTDKKLGDVAFDRLKEEWANKYQGTDNAHKTAILEEGLKAEVIQTSQRDMEFLESRKFNRDQILAMFRTSASILGLMEDANRANAESAEYSFSKRTVKPRIKRLCNVFQEQLAYSMDEKLVIGFEDPVPADKEFELSRKEKSVGKWQTINEIREEEGLDPVDGGDELYQPLSNMPIGQPRPEPVDTSDDEDDAVEDEDMPEQPEEEKGVTKVADLKVAKGTPSTENNMPLESKNKFYNDLKQRQIFGDNWQSVVDKNAIGYEQPFLQVVREFADEQEKAVKKELRKQLKKDFTPTKAKKLPELINFKFWALRLAKAMRPIYATEIKEVGFEASLLVSYSGFDPVDPSIIKFYEKRSTKVSKSVSAETEKQLKATLAEGISKGEKLDDLMGRVTNTYDSLRGHRAERIARTETIRASGFAQIEAWEQSGVVEGKEWFTAKDERVCEFCGPLDGSFRYLGQNFEDKGVTIVGEKGGNLSLDYEDVESPALHVNCRCVMLPFITEG